MNFSKWLQDHFPPSAREARYYSSSKYSPRKVSVQLTHEQAHDWEDNTALARRAQLRAWHPTEYPPRIVPADRDLDPVEQAAHYLPNPY